MLCYLEHGWCNTTCCRCGLLQRNRRSRMRLTLIKCCGACRLLSGKVLRFCVTHLQAAAFAAEFQNWMTPWLDCWILSIFIDCASFSQIVTELSLVFSNIRWLFISFYRFSVFVCRCSIVFSWFPSFANWCSLVVIEFYRFSLFLKMVFIIVRWFS